MSAPGPSPSPAMHPRWRLAVELAAYNLLLAALLPAMAGWLLWRFLARRRGLGRWDHRLGFVPRLPAGGPRVWVHAVSAGEVAAARPVLRALQAALPGARLALSTITAAGMAVARQSCPEAEARFFLPFDLPLCTLRALGRVRPRLVVLAEKELWPNFLGLARLCGARVLVVNGRVSERMMRRARWGEPLVHWLYRLPDHFCVQSPEDARRLRRLGVSAARVTVAGNTKVDALAHRDRPAEERLARELGGGEGEVWLVGGSTHAGEEDALLEAFAALRERLPAARLLLAPRHQERTAAVCARVVERGFPVSRRSEGPPAGRPVVVLDTMGELRAAYGLPGVAFVGGTLAPVGGHNLLEPVAAGRAVLFGPHTENCPDVADLVVEAGVGFRVEAGRDIAERFLWLAADPERSAEIGRRGAALIARQRGAAARCAEVALRLLGGGAA